MRPLLVWRGYWIDEGYVMSEFKGTPGPWFLGGVEDGKQSINTGSCFIALVDEGSSRDANAKLISSAPDLLEALQGLVHADCHSARNSTVHIKALNHALLAINKALGL